MKRLMIIWLFLALPYIATAQTEHIELPSLQAALQRVEAQNGDMKVAQLSETKAQEEAKNQRLAYLPTASIGGNFQYNIDRQTTALPGEIFGRAGETVNVQMGTDFVSVIGLQFQADALPLQTMAQTEFSRRLSELQSSQTASLRQNLREQTALLYHSVLVNRHALVLTRRQIILADSLLRLSEIRYAEGLIDLQALNNARLSPASLRLTALAYEKSIASQSQQLLMLMQYPQNGGVLMLLDSLHTDSAFQRLPAAPATLGKDAQIASSRLRLSAQEADIRLRRSAFYPRISLQGYFGLQQLTNKAFEGDWNRYNYLALNVSIPISQSYRARTQLASSQAQSRIYSQQLENQELRSQHQERQILQDYNYSLQMLPLSYATYRIQLENLALALIKYEQGLTNLDQYLRQQEDCLRAEQQYLQQLSAAFSHYSAILARQ